jgi:hypothetical protein
MTNTGPTSAPSALGHGRLSTQLSILSLVRATWAMGIRCLKGLAKRENEPYTSGIRLTIPKLLRELELDYFGINVKQLFSSRSERSPNASSVRQRSLPFQWRLCFDVL